MIEYYLPMLKDQLKAKSINRSQQDMVAALKATSFDIGNAVKALISRMFFSLECSKFFVF